MRSTVAFLALVVMMAGMWPADDRRVEAQISAAASLVGAWTLNRELSDQPEERSTEDRDAGDRRGGRRGGGGGFRGGFGGGGRGRGGDGGRGGFDPEQTARAREAMKDILNPPAHLTIVQPENMIIITGPDGRTTRLSPDDKKIKDESTKIERRTKWDGGKLVSEISGLGTGKIVESYSVDAERHQLHVTIRRDNDRRPLTINRVYDADQLH
jgi:hypothetical protein